MKFPTFSYFAVGVSVVMVLFAFGLLFFSPGVVQAPVVFERDQDVSGWSRVNYAFAPDSLYERAVEGAANVVEGSDASKSMILPHHLLVGNVMAESLAAIPRRQNVRTVVLIGPNHFDAGFSTLQTAKVVFETPFGELQTDEKLVDALLRKEVVQEEELTFVHEHSISAVAPFVRYYFPNARVLPVILHETASAEERQALAQAIYEVAPDAFVIASIDMSHNLPVAAQRFHDDVTLRAIQNGERRHDLEIDSNASLDVLFAINELRGSRQWHLQSHAASGDLLPSLDWRENTSHIIGYFTQGQAERSRYAAFHVVGDVMLDRGTRRKIEEFGIEYPWVEMGRFLRGVDLRIGNLEGTVNEQPSTFTYDPPFRFVFDPSYIEAMLPYLDVVSLANNHAADVGAGAGQQETRRWLDDIGVKWFGAWETPEPAYDFEIEGMLFRLVGYHEFRPDVERMEQLIAEGDAAGRFVIVVPHWGPEYQYFPSANQRALAELIVAAGADLVIGGHPHVVQGAEMIDGVPVLYSLGNFVFDQQIPMTWQATTVGVIVEDNELVLYFLPVNARDGQPTPLDGFDADRVLQIISDHSDDELKNSILNGVLRIPYERTGT